MNIVCADFVTNGTLAIAWHTFNQYGRTQFEGKVYHINRVSDPKLIFGKMILIHGIRIIISLNRKFIPSHLIHLCSFVFICVERERERKIYILVS